ncbi:MAG: helix-turn-helix domain-containing protein [Paraclostridium sp.]
MDWKIYRNLKFLRENQGLSIEELSKISGVKTSTIKNIENKQSFEHYIDDIAKLAKALNVSVEDFMCKELGGD